MGAAGRGENQASGPPPWNFEKKKLEVKGERNVQKIIP
jgi:hypothetical protein